MFKCMLVQELIYFTGELEEHHNALMFEEVYQQTVGIDLALDLMEEKLRLSRKLEVVVVFATPDVCTDIS
jgi:hypothetical protein